VKAARLCRWAADRSVDLSQASRMSLAKYGRSVQILGLPEVIASSSSVSVSSYGEYPIEWAYIVVGSRAGLVLDRRRR
jgi:hypothetical protein